MTEAVLLMAHGAAASLEDIPAYLQDIRGGRPAPPELVESVRERYRAMGGRSPLLEITQAQAEALARRCGLPVCVGMRHSAPTLLEAAQELFRRGPARVAAMPLTPFASAVSMGAYMSRYAEAVAAAGGRWETAAVHSWNEHPALVDAWATRVREGLARLPGGACALFTAHSLPSRALGEGDPYPGQLRRTAELVARAAGLGYWELAYQSRGWGGEAWLGPDAGETLARLAATGCPGVLLAPIGFLSDHMETLYDDDILYRGKAESLGLRFARAPSLNDDPRLIEALADAALAALRSCPSASSS